MTSSTIIKLMVILLACFSLPTFATSYNSSEASDHYAFMIYHGTMTRNSVASALIGRITSTDEKLYSGEVTYIFRPEAGIRRYFGPIVNSIEANFNFTYHDDDHVPLFEFIPFLSFRWSNFPWKNTLKTSLCLGEGLSWVSHTSIEENQHTKDPVKLLNYLSFEITAALASFPQFEIVGRVHHRSGAFGLFHSPPSASNAVGLGLRCYFDIAHK